MSLLCDETTDISVTMQLHYVIGGDLKVRYFKIREVTDGTADTIKDALLSIIQEAQIPVSKAMEVRLWLVAGVEWLCS